MELAEEVETDDADEVAWDVGAEEAKAVEPEKSTEEFVVRVDWLLRRFEDRSSSSSSLLKSMMWRGPGASWWESADKSCDGS
jgi:hypothetical protein